MKPIRDGSGWIAWNDKQSFTDGDRTVTIAEGTFAARDPVEEHAQFLANQMALERARNEAMKWRNQ